MRLPRLALAVLLAAAASPAWAAPEFPAVTAAMQATVEAHEIAGAVTLVATKDRILHLKATGLADVAGKKPMPADALFWIASMTKPVTSVAILMLQDEGKLSVGDPVAKYIPEFADLKTPSGRPANLTIAQLLRHTSGLADSRPTATRSAKTLRDLVAIYLSEPMQFEPGTTWRYTSSGFTVAGRIVEIVSGQPFDAFLQDRLFDPLGMRDTTFFPTGDQRLRLAQAYRINPATGGFTLQSGLGPNGPIPTRGETPPAGGGGLFSTAADYARFCQMLLNRGTLDGRRYLSDAACQAMTTIGTGDFPTGYTKTKLSHVLGWGLGVAIVRAPDGGVSAQLSPGSFGHPGAWGTAAWIDPTRDAAYVMMVQRTNMPDNFENPPALAFVRAAAESLAAAAQAAPPPPSPPGHGEVHFISVEENVKLEVVDWGGNGRPLILLAGLGGHAHGFSRFAPKLAPSYHVFSITRRGFPPSSVPDSGYSADRLGDDVVAVIDALQLVRPVLAGHSLAGEELSSIATRHPDKVSGLVYLDAGYAYALYDQVHGDLNLDGLEAARDLERLQPGKAPPDVGPIVARLLHTLPLLERELAERRKEMAARPAPPARAAGAPTPPAVPAAIQQIFAGERKYTALPVPVLAIFADPHELGDALKDNPTLRAQVEEQDRARTENQATAFERQVPTARVVRLPHASHLVFQSNEADVLREMQAFIGSLPQPLIPQLSGPDRQFPQGRIREVPVPHCKATGALSGTWLVIRIVSR